MFTLDTGKGGLEVFEVLEDGPWYRAGLKVGDVILEANGQPVPDQTAWDRVVTGPLDQGRFPTRFVVRRDGTEKTLDTARP